MPPERVTIELHDCKTYWAFTFVDPVPGTPRTLAFTCPKDYSYLKWGKP
jgi:hypothetical protein